jgi:hypothetical protein
MPGAVVETERDEQHVARQPLDDPCAELQRGRLGAELGRAEDAQAGAHLRQGPADLRHAGLHAARARRHAPAQQRGQDEHGDEHGHRRDREGHEAALALAEEGRPWRT